MKNSSLFFNFAAYQWAEKFVKDAHYIEIDQKKFFEGLDNQENGADVEVFFFKNTCDDKTLPIMTCRILSHGKVKILSNYVSKQSFEKFEQDEPEITKIFMMNGRIAYKQYLLLGKADFPMIRV